MHELLTLNVVGAFKSPASNVCLYVDNQPGFNYVTLNEAGNWVSQGSLMPAVIDWLVEEDSPTMDIGAGWVNTRLTDWNLGELQCVVYYGSIHHRDER